MRNTWKGMLLGALGGAAVGLALESIDRAARGANNAVHATPEVASRAYLEVTAENSGAVRLYGGRARPLPPLRGCDLTPAPPTPGNVRAAERNGVHH